MLKTIADTEIVFQVEEVAINHVCVISLFLEREVKYSNQTVMLFKRWLNVLIVWL